MNTRGVSSKATILSLSLGLVAVVASSLSGESSRESCTRKILSVVESAEQECLNHPQVKFVRSARALTLRYESSSSAVISNAGWEKQTDKLVWDSDLVEYILECVPGDEMQLDDVLAPFRYALLRI